MIDNLGEAFLRYKFDQDWLIWDVETESLNLGFSRPWQISWIVGRGKNIIDSYDRIIRWNDLQVSEDAARITGFNQESYENRAENPNIVLEDFNSFLYDDKYKISGHNILGFDIYQHNVWMNQLGKKTDYSYINRCYDTLALSRAYKMGLRLSRSLEPLDFTIWQFNILSHYDRKIKCSLSAMAKEFAIYFDHTRLHNALYDIEINYEVLWALLNKMEVK